MELVASLAGIISSRFLGNSETVFVNHRFNVVSFFVVLNSLIWFEDFVSASELFAFAFVA